MPNEDIINEKLETLLQGVSENYGKTLYDELFSRLENTIVDFNEEVGDLMSELKENTSLKDKMMADIKVGKTSDFHSITSESKPKEEDGRDMSEWEKRLENIEK